MSKPKTSLKHDYEEALTRIKELEEIIKHQKSLLCPDDSLTFPVPFYGVSPKRFQQLFSFFDRSYFITLIYDPKFIDFDTDQQAYYYYLRSILKVIEDKTLGLSKCHILGAAEHTKSGQVHVHFCIKFYAENDVHRFMFYIKRFMTHRLYLNVSTNLKLTNERALDYMIKEGWQLYAYGTGMGIHDSDLLSYNKNEPVVSA